MPSRRWRSVDLQSRCRCRHRQPGCCLPGNCAPHAGPRCRDGRQPDRRSCANDAARRAQGRRSWRPPAAITAAGSSRRAPMPRSGSGTPARARWCARSNSTKALRPRWPSATGALWPGTRAAPSFSGISRRPKRSARSSSAAPPPSHRSHSRPKPMSLLRRRRMAVLPCSIRARLRAPSMLLDGRDGTGMIVTASLGRGFVASAGADRTVRLWRAETESLTRTYRIPAGEIAALDISSDGRYLAAAITDGSIRVWSNSSSRAIRTFKAHQARVGAIAFGPDRLLATASDDGKVKVWNLRAGRVVRTLSGGTGPLRALSFTPDGRRIIGCRSGRRDPRVVARSGACERHLATRSRNSARCSWAAIIVSES